VSPDAPGANLFDSLLSGAFLAKKVDDDISALIGQF
jgi:hypothetical protein